MKINEIFDLDKMPGTVYVMSDLHIGHKNVIDYDSRPFNSLDEMNESILEELCTKLKPEDTLIDLGDLFWSMNWNRCKEILDKIPARRFYKVLGNHDKVNLYLGNQPILRYRFEGVSETLEIKLKWEGEDYRMSMCHFPMLDWNHKYRGSMMVHGHTHGSIDELNESSSDLRVDIGYSSEIANQVGSFLIPLPEIIKHFYKKTGGIIFSDWATTKS